MSNRTGFLVVNQKSGYMLEGKDHAAKIFDRQADAHRSCPTLSFNKPVSIDYDNAVRSLLKGSAFCFDCDEGHQKFLGRLRNDTANKPFLAFSKDRAFVKWRFQKSAGSPSNAVTDIAASVPLKSTPGSSPFNPDILVRK